MTLQQAKQALEQGLRVTHKNGQYLMGDDWYLVLAADKHTMDGHGTTKPIDRWVSVHGGCPYDWNEGWSIVPRTVVEEGELAGHAYPGHETWNDIPTEDDLDYPNRDDITY